MIQPTLLTSLDTPIPLCPRPVSPCSILILPPPSTSTTCTRTRTHTDISSSPLQLLQYLQGVGSTRIRVSFELLFRVTAPSNLLDHIVWICLPNNGDLRSKPLLERLCDKVPVGSEPSSKGRANVESLRCR